MYPIMLHQFRWIECKFHRTVPDTATPVDSYIAPRMTTSEAASGADPNTSPADTTYQPQAQRNQRRFPQRVGANNPLPQWYNRAWAAK